MATAAPRMPRGRCDANGLYEVSEQRAVSASALPRTPAPWPLPNQEPCARCPTGIGSGDPPREATRFRVQPALSRGIGDGPCPREVIGYNLFENLEDAPPVTSRGLFEACFERGRQPPAIDLRLTAHVLQRSATWIGRRSPVEALNSVGDRPWLRFAPPTPRGASH